MSTTHQATCPACNAALEGGVQAGSTLLASCQCGWQGEVALPQPGAAPSTEEPSDGWVGYVWAAGIAGSGIAGGSYGVWTGGVLFGIFCALAGVVAGVAGAVAVALIVTLVARLARDWRCRRDYAHGPHAGFRLSIASHNLVAYLVTGTSVVGSVAVLIWFREYAPEDGLYRSALVLGTLVASVTLPKMLFQILVPARCPACGGSAYHQLGEVVGQQTVGHYTSDVWSTSFLCRACGKKSHGGTD